MQWYIERPSIILGFVKSIKMSFLFYAGLLCLTLNHQAKAQAPLEYPPNWVGPNGKLYRRAFVKTSDSNYMEQKIKKSFAVK